MPPQATMAGMISLLHNSQMRLDAQADDAETSSIGKRTPVMQKRQFKPRLNQQNLNAEKLPKQFRRQRCTEIHPILRRSVCSLILAAIAIALGTSLLAGSLSIKRNAISNRMFETGFVFLAFGCALLVIGTIWYCCSKRQVEKIEQTLMEEKERQLLRNNEYARIFPGKLEQNCSTHFRDWISNNSTSWPQKVKSVEIADPQQSNINKNSEIKFVCEITTPSGVRKKQFKYPSCGDITQDVYSQHEKGIPEGMVLLPNSASASNISTHDVSEHLLTEYITKSSPGLTVC